MPRRENSHSDPSRLPIFKANIEALIRKATRFTMRHKYDVEKLRSIVDPSLHDKIEFEFCPTIWYCKTYWDDKADNAIAIEVKDDRPNRRYKGLGRQKFYKRLLARVKQYQSEGKKVVYLSHDGSRSFHTFAKQHGVTLPYIDNSVANETRIRSNYSKFNTIMCMAGHSQMISYALGKKVISVNSHPKLKAFCQVTGMDWVNL